MALSVEQKEDIRRREKFVFENYFKMTVKELSLCTGMSVSGMHKLINRLGLKSYNLNCNRTINEQVEEDSNWFYFVGLMLADGSISHNTIQINLCNDDRDILEKLAVWLELKTGVHKYKASKNSYTVRDRCMLSFNSGVIKERLNKYGVVSKKTGYEDYRNIPDEYFFDFLRGFMDGDGCTSGGRVAFYSNEKLIKKLEEDIYLKLGIRGYVNYDISTVWRLTYTVSDSLKLANCMYKETELFLSRKRENLRR